MNRAYYSASSEDFVIDNENVILGKLTRNHHFSLEENQRNAWLEQIKILKPILAELPGAYLAFEFVIPRMGKRVDVIILYQGFVFVLEFKVGMSTYENDALMQALDYAIDLKNFHEPSHNAPIVPMLVSTNAKNIEPTITFYPDKVAKPISVNSNNLLEILIRIASEIDCENRRSPEQWLNGIYKPTPTIVQAAQALYKGHDVKEISRSDSGAINLQATSNELLDIIEKSKNKKRKSICFVTGVPGAGKTLAGLNIANQQHNAEKGEHAVFLSGNGPLVLVLQEALARDEVASTKRTSGKITKSIAINKTKAFIQNIHHFRDDALSNNQPPAERIAIFDEAQRAWDKKATQSFMKTKKGIPHFEMSEPEFLISVLDRHDDWAVIICLIGGGQEINKGEAGISQWFESVGDKFKHWDIYASNQLTSKEYTAGNDLYGFLADNRLNIKPNLHLDVSVRSFRSEKLSSFVKNLLNLNLEQTKIIQRELIKSYPIVISRNIHIAKKWIKKMARGSESSGVVASSGAIRLKPYGIHIKSEIDPKSWFLNVKSDIRSSGFLEDVATEFDIQGLELDWVCLAWDADLRLINDTWHYKKFRGTKWQNVNKPISQQYLLNAYRVLLTRARQGMVIFIPQGDSDDPTRPPQFYDPLYNYLKSCGLPQI